MIPDIDRRLQRYLRSRVGSGAGPAHEAVRIGPFLACFDRSSANPFRNFAVPDDGSRPRRRAIGQLVDAALSRGRAPRLEYFPTAAPDVEGRMVAASFGVERRLPVMMRRTAAPPVAAGADGFAVAPVEAGSAAVAAAVAATHAAFGEGPPDSGDVARLHQTLAEGGGAVIAVERRSGEVAGSGRFCAPVDGVTELTGVGVVPGHRRRGVAAAITAGLVELAGALGVHSTWLAPEGPEAGRVYRRVGFETVSEALHLGYDQP